MIAVEVMSGGPQGRGWVADRRNDESTGTSSICRSCRYHAERSEGDDLAIRRARRDKRFHGASQRQVWRFFSKRGKSRSVGGDSNTIAIFIDPQPLNSLLHLLLRVLANSTITSNINSEACSRRAKHTIPCSCDLGKSLRAPSALKWVIVSACEARACGEMREKE